MYEMVDYVIGYIYSLIKLYVDIIWPINYLLRFLIFVIAMNLLCFLIITYHSLIILLVFVESVIVIADLGFSAFN